MLEPKDPTFRILFWVIKELEHFHTFKSLVRSEDVVLILGFHFFKKQKILDAASDVGHMKVSCCNLFLNSKLVRDSEQECIKGMQTSWKGQYASFV